MRHLIYIIVGLAALAACSGEKKRILGEAIGGEGEVLLVVDKTIDESDLRDTLDLILAGPTPGLNQPEPFFRLVHLQRKNYNRRYASMHSILIVAVQPKAKATTIGAANDVNSKGQTVVELVAPDLGALRAFLTPHKAQLRDLLLDGQLQRKARELRQRHNGRVAADLSRHLGLTLCAPNDVKFDKLGQGFFWASDRKPEENLNIVVYTLPLTAYNDTAFAHSRDSVMKRHIPGATPRQWMATVWENGTPVILSRERKGYVEVRGLWEMHDGPMGGPFVAHIHRDKKKGRLVVAEGFVYSPSTDKRDLLRTLEAALLTLKENKE